MLFAGVLGCCWSFRGLVVLWGVMLGRDAWLALRILCLMGEGSRVVEVSECYLVMGPSEVSETSFGWWMAWMNLRV